jgi:hypothetical protein
MKTYRSALSPVLWTIIGLCWTLLVWTNLVARDWTPLLVLVAVALIFFLLYLSTTYTIIGDTLHVKSGFIIRERLDIGKIKRIVKIRDFLAAPAFSLDRLVISDGERHSVVISPLNRVSFVRDLLKLNPAIAVEGVVLTDEDHG